jgi:hypothetical protein
VVVEVAEIGESPPTVPGAEGADDGLQDEWVPQGRLAGKYVSHGNILLFATASTIAAGAPGHRVRRCFNVWKMAFPD